MEREIPTCPVAGWQIGPVSALQAVMVRLDYLTHATQAAQEANQSPQYVLTDAQARELADALRKHAALSESGGPQGAGFPQH